MCFAFRAHTHLFDRIANQWQMVPLVIYFPIGLCLLIVRVFIGLHAFLVASLLPKSSVVRCFIIRTMCAVLGFIVREEHMHFKRKVGVKLLVANHITDFDHLAVDLVLPCIVPIISDSPKFLNWSLGLHDFGTKNGGDTFTQNVKHYLSSCEVPILMHPENATTNGRSGLLKFNSLPFTLDSIVHPLCISVSRPSPLEVSPTVLGSRWWSDLFWILLTPFTVFTLKYLESIHQKEGESVDEFAKRVQIEMASAMNVAATNYTEADKLEYMKRIAHSASDNSSSQHQQKQTIISSASAQRNISNPLLESTSQIERMAIRVKEVLPQVPIEVVKKDLAITANIDETITRLLDGTISYKAETVVNSRPEAQTQKDSQSSNQSNISKSELGLNTSAKTFGKSAFERMRSYKERKEALIEASRARYLRKHPEILMKMAKR
ncbi:ancient ubiquitous protein 1-like protein [Dinothrombium tinctorium]|uniref:Lipid droplet-regulating VLDL assembly factor AUP1 n=1 Tax=Dinothrombium tinctorium TaxID=1965070 RepID=A0A443QYD0_9ACAR|nr:ancient ubiquitous protein 1-like protein [Dinothrombium tinctorium]RWS08029.1 ancient ubiquitous protein 1-like protein [Dinothrombium tinctorium]